MFWFALAIVLILLAIKLLFNYFTHPKAPLTIVPNKMVEAIVVKKYIYRFKISEIKGISTFIVPDLTPSDLVKASPSKSGNFSGKNRRLFIYNQGPETFTIKGLSFFAKARITTTDKSIFSTRKVRGTETESEYKGEPLEIGVNEEIELQNIDDYEVSRLLLSTDNSKGRNITIYVYDKTNSLYYIVTTGPFERNFLLIDLYE